MASSSERSTRDRVRWMWKSNKDPWSKTEEEQWTPYDDDTNAIIEQASKSNGKRIQIGDYYIDFKRSVQISKYDENKQRRVKRIEEPIEQEFRTNVSDSPKKIVPYKTINHGAIGTFLWEAFTVGKWRDVDLKILVDRAAQGIIEEGTKLDKGTEAKRLAEKLLEKRTGKRGEIWRQCVYLYSCESFLYQKTSQVLRSVGVAGYEDEWKQALPTLGLFIWFLFDYPEDLPEFKGIVYRAVTMTDEEIDVFKRYCKTGEIAQFSSFSSTTKSRSLAEIFCGNTLMIIRTASNCVDISSLSAFRDEQECLLNPSFAFRVEKIEFNPATKKTEIYLRDINL